MLLIISPQNEKRGPKMSIRVLFLLIVFSEIIGTKLGRNAHWIVCECFFFVDQKYTKETRGPNVSKSVVLMVSSETTGPIGNKLGRNVHWMVR
jgi:hypothetical protein